MKKNILVLAVFLLSYIGFSQVGINNTDPKASLDVTATNQAAPANTDGLLIPRIDDFPGTNPGVNQQGMMVYLTTISGSNPPGFYYWDQTTTAWISIVGVKGTLDEAYDQGGAGAGKNITADSGAVSISGTDGLQITGTQGSGATVSLSGAGTRMFFNPNKAAFRSGTVDGTQWNNANIGDYSTAFGNNVIASSIYSTAFGNAQNVTGTAGVAMGTGHTVDGFAATALGGGNTSSGSWSLATGVLTSALGQGSFSSGEETEANGEHTAAFGFGTQSDASHSFSLGRYNTGGGSNNTWVPTDPVFQIGNGENSGNRTDAFTILKNGNTGIGVSNPVNPLEIGISTPFDLSYSNIGQDGIYIYGGAIGGINEIGGSISFGAAHPLRSNSRRAAIASVQTSGDADLVGLAFYVHKNPINQSPMEEVMRLNHQGYLGINNASPSANLDVVGSMQYVDGNETLGHILSSDASGNATWIDPATIGDGDTQNTLDQAYDEGGAGVGRTINTTNGAVLLNGADGLEIRGASADIVISNQSENESGIHFRDSGNTSQYADINYDNSNSNNTLNIYVNSATALMTLDDNQSVGIGTTTPDYTLSVSGVANLKEDDATVGVALRVNGSEALWFDGSRFSWGYGGSSNTFADNVGIGLTSVPSYKLDVRGNSAGNPIANFLNNNDIPQADGIRVQLYNTLPNSSAYYIAFQRDIGNTPTLSGRVSGSAAGTGVNYLTTSDRRLKTQITEYKNALNVIEKIHTTEYVYKSNPKVKEIGFIAQELKKVYPQAVAGDENGDPNKNPMMVDYSRLTPLLAAGIKELKKEVDALKQENQKLKQELANYKSLEQRLLAIENKLK